MMIVVIIMLTFMVDRADSAMCTSACAWRSRMRRHRTRGSWTTRQGGSFGEHQIVAVTQEGVRTRVADSSFQVVLAPSSGTTLEIEQRRYVNKPSYEFPWNP